MVSFTHALFGGRFRQLFCSRIIFCFFFKKICVFLSGFGRWVRILCPLSRRRRRISRSSKDEDEDDDEDDKEKETGKSLVTPHLVCGGRGFFDHYLRFAQEDSGKKPVIPKSLQAIPLSQTFFEFGGDQLTAFRQFRMRLFPFTHLVTRHGLNNMGRCHPARIIFMIG